MKHSSQLGFKKEKKNEMKRLAKQFAESDLMDLFDVTAQLNLTKSDCHLNLANEEIEW